MMLIPTHLAASAIHGIGMFTEVDVAAGTVLWTFVHGFDRDLSDAAFRSLPLIAQLFIRRHGFRTMQGLWVIGGDNDQFVNHSPTPNMVEAGPLVMPTGDLVAARNIAAGEELTQNYLEWDAQVEDKQLTLPEPPHA